MRLLVAAVVLLVAACRDDRPPAPTQQQNAQLNEASNMLDELGNEEGPADRSTGPSNSSD
jgi:hypothetical protein